MFLEIIFFISAAIITFYITGGFKNRSNRIGCLVMVIMLILIIMFLFRLIF